MIVYFPNPNIRYSLFKHLQDSFNYFPEADGVPALYAVPLISEEKMEPQSILKNIFVPFLTSLTSSAFVEFDRESPEGRVSTVTHLSKTVARSTNYLDSSMPYFAFLTAYTNAIFKAVPKGDVFNRRQGPAFFARRESELEQAMSKALTFTDLNLRSILTLHRDSISDKENIAASFFKHELSRLTSNLITVLTVGAFYDETIDAEKRYPDQILDMFDKTFNVHCSFAVQFKKLQLELGY